MGCTGAGGDVDPGPVRVAGDCPGEESAWEAMSRSAGQQDCPGVRVHASRRVVDHRGRDATVR